MEAVSLDLLRTFLAVYRAGRLTGAASTLGLSQPSVTGQLRRLERRLGTPLFTRQARGVIPTASAHDLARRLDGPLDALSAVAAQLGDGSALAGRTLRLAGPAELLATRVLPALAGTVGVGVTIRTSLGLADELLHGLACGHLDLVVSTVRPRLKGLHSEPLCDEEFVLIATPDLVGQVDGTLLAQQPGKALHALPLLAYAEELPIIRRWWRHVLGVPPTGRATLVVPDLRALRAAAVAGLGATVLPRYLCVDDLSSGRLVEVVTTEDPPINTLYLATRSVARNEPHVAHAWDALQLQARLW